MSDLERDLAKERARKADEKLLRDIEQFGWHVMLIFGTEETPAFAYTVGLYHSYGHPEVLILGLDLDGMHEILNNIGNDVKAGGRFESGKRYPDILERYDCTFQMIERAFYPNYLGIASWYYRGDDFPALQCLWPDPEGHFPGEKEFAIRFAAHQSLRLRSAST